MEEKQTNFLVYVLGNKLDLFDERKISKEDVNFFLSSKNYKYVEVSCKWDLNVSDSIYQMAMELAYKDTNKKVVDRRSVLRRTTVSNDDSCCD